MNEQFFLYFPTKILYVHVHNVNMYEGRIESTKKKPYAEGINRTKIKKNGIRFIKHKIKCVYNVLFVLLRYVEPEESKVNYSLERK